MLDMELQNYIDWHVKPVMRLKGGYGYRVILKYMDKSDKTQQKSGFSSEKEAKLARNKTIAELHNGTYIVYGNVTVTEFMEYWLEEDVKNRINSYETYATFSGIVKNHVIPAMGKKKMAEFQEELLGIVVDTGEYLGKDGNANTG